MAAFDKVPSGYPSMDDVLDFIRIGDNVVWQVSGLEEFNYFVQPFVSQSSSWPGRGIIFQKSVPTARS